MQNRATRSSVSLPSPVFILFDMGFASVLIVMLKSFITGTATMVASHTTQNKIHGTRSCVRELEGVREGKGKKWVCGSVDTAEDPGPVSDRS